MAILNGLYIHVVDETLTADVEGTSHPVESGLPIADTIRARPMTISLSGKIVDYGILKADQVIEQIKRLKDTGSLIDYRGRNVASSMQIQSFSASFPNTNNGGADFDMELKQVRIAKSAYVPKKPVELSKKKDISSVRVGQVVVFKGGKVYVSSDSTIAAATRGRSTCKVTKISKASYSKHQYHLISTDGKMVFGWVDVENIELPFATSTSGKTNAGTQQIEINSREPAVYHTVKQGDTVWALVNNKYKSLNTTCSAVIKNNPSAFSRPGDATTLKIGATLLMGYK